LAALLSKVDPLSALRELVRVSNPSKGSTVEEIVRSAKGSGEAVRAQDRPEPSEPSPCDAFRRENPQVFSGPPKEDEIWRRLADKCLCETWLRNREREPISGQSIKPDSEEQRSIDGWIKLWCRELKSGGLDHNEEIGDAINGVELSVEEYRESIRKLSELGRAKLQLVLECPGPDQVTRDEFLAVVEEMKAILPDELVSDRKERTRFRRAMVRRALAALDAPV
jgi:hypothetical protein